MNLFLDFSIAAFIVVVCVDAFQCRRQNQKD